VAGWNADLSRFSEGRIAARRVEPAPQADLRLVLDR
jgi:outer membrane lipoprotein LolB